MARLWRAILLVAGPVLGKVAPNRNQQAGIGMETNAVTQCLTMGRRPDLLQQTLQSLTPLRHLPTLAVNDFGDPASSAVFLDVWPGGKIVPQDGHLGHHPVIDRMYAHVHTPYVFHNEDDWLFERTDFLAPALRLLEAEPRITVVCLRRTDDIPLPDEARARITRERAGGVDYARLDALHPQWHGFTLNPHVARLDLWRELGGYARFAKERHLSRHLRAQGRFVAFLDPGACRHIGEDRSLTPRRPTLLAQVRGWLGARR